MNGIQRCAGINITASRLQFVEVEKESNQLVVTNIGQTFISPPINFDELDSGLLPGKNNALVVALNKKYLILIKYFCSQNYLTPRLVDNASITANNFINNRAVAAKQSVTINIFNSRNSITLFVNI